MDIYTHYFRFDTEKRRWKNIASMNCARAAGMGATVLNGYIYIAGGACSTHQNSFFEVYDPEKDHWTKHNTMFRNHRSCTLVAAGGFLYAHGQGGLERFDPNKGCWTVVCELNGQR